MKSCELCGDGFVHSAVPNGIISMWFGSLEELPKGWVLCDGKNGSPNLCDKMPLGAGGKYALGEEGGSEAHSHKLTINDTVLTVAQMPAHIHHYGFSTTGARGGSEGNPNGYSPINAQTLSTGGNKGHNHTGKLDSTETLPPYTAVYFIMKL